MPNLVFRPEHKSGFDKPEEEKTAAVPHHMYCDRRQDVAQEMEGN